MDRDLENCYIVELLNRETRECSNLPFFLLIAVAALFQAAIESDKQNRQKRFERNIELTEATDTSTNSTGATGIRRRSDS